MQPAEADLELDRLSARCHWGLCVGALALGAIVALALFWVVIVAVG